MFGIGKLELIVVGVVMVVLHVPVYRAYRRNMENRIPPKIWAAVLLSILPSPVGGILYTTGIVPAVISFCGFVGVVIAAELLMHFPFDSNKGYYILVMAIISGILAKNKKDSLSSF